MFTLSGKPFIKYSITDLFWDRWPTVPYNKDNIFSLCVALNIDLTFILVQLLNCIKGVIDYVSQYPHYPVNMISYIHGTHIQIKYNPAFVAIRPVHFHRD